MYLSAAHSSARACFTARAMLQRLRSSTLSRDYEQEAIACSTRNT